MAKISITLEDAQIDGKNVISMKIDHDVVESNEPPTPAMCTAADLVKYFQDKSRPVVEAAQAIAAPVEESAVAVAADAE
jgi:hypothetical protein